MPDGLGPGERAARERRRRFWGILGGLTLVGAAVGFAIGYLQANAGGPAPRIPAGWAIALTAVMLAAFAYGSWRFFASVDEVERRDNYLASTIGLYVYTALYGSWFLLWQGQVVREPDHLILFAVTMAATVIAYLWKKLRP